MYKVEYNDDLSLTCAFLLPTMSKVYNVIDRTICYLQEVVYTYQDGKPLKKTRRKTELVFSLHFRIIHYLILDIK